MDGVSVYHIVNILKEATSTGLDEKMRQDRSFIATKEEATIWHMVQVRLRSADFHI